MKRFRVNIPITDREFEAITNATDLYMREYDNLVKVPRFMTADLNCLNNVLFKINAAAKIEAVSKLPKGENNESIILAR